MTDIVLRMKALPDLTNEKAWEVVHEGAAEIEKLRAALEEISAAEDAAPDQLRDAFQTVRAALKH